MRLQNDIIKHTTKQGRITKGFPGATTSPAENIPAGAP